MTKEDWDRHNAADGCWVCDGPFGPYMYKEGDCHGLWKVKDHDHISGEYRGAAYSKCNLLLRIDPYYTPVPVFFHNLKNYDAHHLMSAIGRTGEKQTAMTDKDGVPIMKKDKDGKDTNEPRKVTDGGISAIVQNMEKMIAFSWGQYRFVDSNAFLSSSLDRLVNWQYTQGRPRRYQTVLSTKFRGWSLVTQRRLPVGMHDGLWTIWRKAAIPPQEKFYSSLTDGGISDEDYRHALQAWRSFQCSNLGDYHDLCGCRCQVLARTTHHCTVFVHTSGSCTPS